jgi:DNA-directed RNA polymerase specialized sigma24 family protein
VNQGQPEGRAAEIDLLRRCLSNDRAAIDRFQECFGPLVYAYPVRVYRLPEGEAGAFYVYAFTDGRIFRRARSFEGRASLRSFLSGYVLDHLVLEWRRGDRRVATVPLDSVPEPAQPEVPEFDACSSSLIFAREPRALVVKLLFIEDYDLQPEEIRRIARESGRTLRDVLERIEGLRATVRAREHGMEALEESLAAIHAWIQLYERRVAAIDADLESAPASSSLATRLRAERHDLLRKLLARRQQRARTTADLRRRKVTAPYKDIAALLNTSINNVASQIRRLRIDLAQQRERPPHQGH